MDKEELVKKVSNPKVAEYGYSVAFVVIFMFFLVFFIRPTLLQIATIQSQLADLRGQNDRYGTIIERISQLQSLLEAYRKDFPLLETALPRQPRIYQIVTDLSALVQENNLNTPGFSFPAIVAGYDASKEAALRTGQKETATVNMVIGSEATFEQIQNTVASVSSQLRTKTIRSLDISRIVVKGENPASSKMLQMTIELQFHYL
jgi:hypothetical protein